MKTKKKTLTDHYSIPMAASINSCVRARLSSAMMSRMSCLAAARCSGVDGGAGGGGGVPAALGGGAGLGVIPAVACFAWHCSEPWPPSSDARAGGRQGGLLQRLDRESDKARAEAAAVACGGAAQARVVASRRLSCRERARGATAAVAAEVGGSSREVGRPHGLASSRACLISLFFPGVLSEVGSRGSREREGREKGEAQD